MCYRECDDETICYLTKNGSNNLDLDDSCNIENYKVKVHCNYDTKKCPELLNDSCDWNYDDFKDVKCGKNYVDTKNRILLESICEPKCKPRCINAKCVDVNVCQCLSRFETFVTNISCKYTKKKYFKTTNFHFHQQRVV